MQVPKKTLTFVLAGGVGSRLHPLTAERAKPAVPFGGKYRIIDFTLSNCLHSGLRQILVLTQYKSHSLQKHLRDGWSIFNPGIGEYVTVVPPQMRTGDSWYRGTADAIYQNLFLLERSHAEYVLVLSGDHIYRMDYAAMLESHDHNAADITLACMSVPVDQGSSFGIVELDDKQRIVGFEEKPGSPTPLPSNRTRTMASMGVYLFKANVLKEVLRADNARESSQHDFGQDILPRVIHDHDVFAYGFGGSEGRVSVDRYWRDVGTVDAYYAANMELLQATPAMKLDQRTWPIYTAVGQNPPSRSLPGSRGNDSQIYNSILSSGSFVRGGVIRDSVLSQNVTVEEGAVIVDSILFDDVTVGEGAKLKNCIVDKNVSIPANETVGFDLDRDRERFQITPNGIVVVPKNYKFCADNLFGSTERSVPASGRALEARYPISVGS